MTVGDLGTQYATGLSRQGIERALAAAGRDTDHLAPADLGALEDFHTMGRIATGQLADRAGITSRDRVLDAGAGIGGTARYLAATFDCQVTAVDLTGEYCETASWLNRLTGLDGKITVRQADVTRLPYPDASFDVVMSQHVQMNIPDKVRLYGEAGRVLAAGGRLAIWDITAGDFGSLDYPLPWADLPGRGHLVTPQVLRAAIEDAGFTVGHWADLTSDATALMQAVLARPPAPLSLHAFVPDFTAKAANLTEALADGRLRAIQAVAHA
jgi:SAM-dependent methyltransferase